MAQNHRSEIWELFLSQTGGWCKTAMQSPQIKHYRKNKALDAIFCCNFYRYRVVGKLHQKSESGLILGAG